MGCSCASKKLGKVMSQSNPYSLGGIAASAGSGVMSGAALGIPGMIGGGVLGLLKGAIGHKQEKDAAKAEEQKAIDEKALIMKNKMASLPAGTKGVVPGVANPYMLALGGMVPSNTGETDLVEYNGGGSHEQNPLGGIPIGMGANGKPNTVEHGEASYKFKNKEGKYDNYIFSNRLIV